VEAAARIIEEVYHRQMDQPWQQAGNGRLAQAQASTSAAANQQAYHAAANGHAPTTSQQQGRPQPQQQPQQPQQPQLSVIRCGSSPCQHAP
jgi:hypothetical protein